ncbi:MAG: hypothetical protein K2X69_10365 [Silvanigrellaceae bacterium]|nr:hypothetical protein [Silvanigrellaceae bacterium]
MKNSDSKVVSWTLIGGMVGIGVLAAFVALRKKETSLDHVSKVISNVGKILESHQIDEPPPIKNFGKKLQHNEDTVSAIVDWIATGISLWGKFKN